MKAFVTTPGPTIRGGKVILDGVEQQAVRAVRVDMHVDRPNVITVEFVAMAFEGITEADVKYECLILDPADKVEYRGYGLTVAEALRACANQWEASKK